MKIMIVFGTRPEAIKLAPIIIELKRKRHRFDYVTCVTAQHRHMLDQVLQIFSIRPNYDLNIMKNNQSLFDISVRALKELKIILEKEKPDLIMVQGDTTTTFIASLASFYLKIPIAHVEAGLRTNNKYSPFPEELNRRLTSHLADYHFAPTQLAKENLLKEGINENQIFVTGNTVVDSLFYILKRLKGKPKDIAGLGNLEVTNTRLILVTCHRRESFGRGFREICEGIKKIALCNPDVIIIYPVHLNPNLKKPVDSILGNLPNVYLTEPLDYASFIQLLTASYIILTDSGGVQEEAPSLGKPVLVMRETTERPEGVLAGVSKLIGLENHLIHSEVQKLLDSKQEYRRMANVVNPFGDGNASKKIVEILSKLHIKGRSSEQSWSRSISNAKKD